MPHGILLNLKCPFASDIALQRALGCSEQKKKNVKNVRIKKFLKKERKNEVLKTAF